MSDLTKAQQAALTELFEAGTPMTISKKTANALITSGLAQIAKVSPIPAAKEGLPVSITTKGRSLCQKRTEQPDEEVLDDETPAGMSALNARDDESE